MKKLANKFRLSPTQYLPEHQGIKLVYRGSQRHYQIIRANAQQLRNKKQKLYLYQRQPIDICYQMLKTKSGLVTYITNKNYQTVRSISKNKDNEQTLSLKDTKQITNQSLTNFMQKHELRIKTGFLDLHPLQAYHKMCSFLDIKKEQQITKLFGRCSFTLHCINQNKTILPFLKQLRLRYLQTNQLKLRKLDRKRQATQQQIINALEYWKKHYLLPQIEHSTNQEQNFKRKYIIQKNLGQFVKIQDLIQGYGQKSFYCLWQEEKYN